MLFHTLNSEMTPYTFTVEPTATNETTSHLVDTKPTESAIVDVKESHLVNARDLYGNLQIHTDDVFSVYLTNTANPQITYTGTSTAIADGIYQLEYTILVSGSYLLEIMVQPGGTGPAYHIKDSNLAVVCVVNEVDASNTVLSGQGVTDSMAGVVATFTVTLFDVGQNQRETGGDSILV